MSYDYIMDIHNCEFQISRMEWGIYLIELWLYVIELWISVINFTHINENESVSVFVNGKVFRGFISYEL